jgi:hypothetical protein
VAVLCDYPNDLEMFTNALDTSADGRQALYMSHPLYDATAHCQDLPELLPVDESGPALALPTTDHDTVVAAVRARQELGGGVCQEKVDGCWCAMVLDADGRVGTATSRAGLPLRYARSAPGWVGVTISPVLAGWTIVGELEAGTTRASQRRDDGRPWLHVYAMFGPDGADRSDELARICWDLGVERMRPVRQALPGEDWGDFTRRILDQGGEGVVIRQGGHCYRAKPQLEVDRVISRVFSERDRHGKMRLKAQLAVASRQGKSLRFRPLQIVILPRNIDAVGAVKRVAKITGASITPQGVVRHARIVELRPEEEKQLHECRLR